MESASAVASTEQVMFFPRGPFLVTAIAVASGAIAAPAPSDDRYQQWQRLSQSTDRDSVTAAAWVAMPTKPGDKLPDDFDMFERRVATKFSNDPQVLFALATICQQVDHQCADARYYTQLVHVEPQNAINWLLLPNHAAPNAEQLHAAAAAQYVDSNLRTSLRVVRASLVARGADKQTVDDIAENVPLPEFRGFVEVCRSAANAPVAECAALANQLVDDRSGALLTRMIASATIQRMMKGTPEALAAKQMRRDYVWLDEHIKTLIPDHDRWQEAIIRYGEWDAMLRSADNAGVARTPPADWMPRDPQSVLLSEERTAAK